MTHRIEPFSFKLDSKNWIFFFEYDAKNWIFFFLIPLKEWNLFLVRLKEVNLFLTWLKEVNFFFFGKSLKELNFFFQYDSQNWTFFNTNTTHRNGLISWIWRKELNPLFLEYDAKSWTVWFLKMTHRIEPSFFVTRRIELFFLHMTQRIEVIFEWLKELNFFSVSTHRIELFLEQDSRNWTLFFKMTLRFEPFFSLSMTQRIEPFSDTTWLIEPLFLYDPKNWTFFKKTQRNERFFISLKELNFFPVWLTELNLFFWKTKRITELNLFFWMRLTEMDLFLEYDAKNWTLFSWIWLFLWNISRANWSLFTESSTICSHRSACEFNGETVFPFEIGLCRICSDFRTVLSLEDKTNAQHEKGRFTVDFVHSAFWVNRHSWSRSLLGNLTSKMSLLCASQWRRSKIAEYFVEIPSPVCSPLLLLSDPLRRSFIIPWFVRTSRLGWDAEVKACP